MMQKERIKHGTLSNLDVFERRCKMTDKRKDCPMRHENGNCTVAGGFCTAVNDPICEALHSAFDCGYRSAIRAWQEVESKLKVVESNAPLTLDELRKMDGEPVWIVEDPDWGHWELSADAEDYVTDREPSFYGMKHNDQAGRYGLHKLGWLAYRRKPEDGTE